MTETTQQKASESKTIPEKNGLKTPEKQAAAIKPKKKNGGSLFLSFIVFVLLTATVVLCLPQTREMSKRMYQEKIVPMVQKAMFWKKTTPVDETLIDKIEVVTEDGIDTLKDRVEQLENARDFENADQVIVTMDEQTRVSSDDVAALTSRLNALMERVDSLEKQNAFLQNKTFLLEKEKADGEVVKTVVERMRQTEAKLQESATERVKTAAMLMTLAQLRRAVADGKPFLVEEQALAHFVEPKSVLAQKMIPLKAYAEKGVMTPAALQEAFPEYARRLIVENETGDANGWIEKSLSGLKSLIVVRRLDAPVDDMSTKAVLARAEIAVENGQLQTAVTTLKNLNNNDVSVVMPWISAAERTLLVDNALNEMTAILLSQKFAR